MHGGHDCIEVEGVVAVAVGRGLEARRHLCIFIRAQRWSDQQRTVYDAHEYMYIYNNIV